LSFPRPHGPAQAGLWRRVGRRVAALIAIGLLLNWTAELATAIWATDPGSGTLGHVRIPGVLQRIALCYLLGIALVLATARRDAEGRATVNGLAICLAIAIGLLLYWALMSFVPVPGYGPGRLDPEGNLAAFLDRSLFTTPHLWRLGSAVWGGTPTYDPEGLLSTLPATANLLFGVLAAREWRAAPGRAPLRIAAGGLLLLVAGLLLDPVFPINKRIWTSSFALLSGGFSALVLAALLVALRSPAAVRLAAPLRILGANAILAFILSILLGQFSGVPLFGPADAPVTPQKWGNDIALALIPDPYLASLACAFAILALIILVVWPLHRRAIHFRL
jgi:predicted acyltransferase